MELTDSKPEYQKGGLIFLKDILLLTLITIIGYCLTIKGLGYYWDDHGIYVGYAFGNKAVWELIANDRPFTGYIYMILLSILGFAPIKWHIYEVVLIWLSGISFYYLIIKIWPALRYMAVWLGMLLIVYPGFADSSLAYIYSAAYMQFLFYLWSLILMISYLKETKNKFLFLFLSYFPLLVNLIMSEYFIGLELGRVLFIFMFFTTSEQKLFPAKKIWPTLKKWLPYAIVMVLFLIYRVFIFHPHRSSVSQGAILSNLTHDPAHWLGGRMFNMFSDLIYIPVVCWTQCFKLGSPIMYLFLFLLAIVVFWGGKYIINNKKGNDDNSDILIGRKFIVYGIILVILGQSVMWFAGLFRDINDPVTSRFVLPGIVGSCLVICGLVTLLLKNKMYQLIVMGLIIGSATLFQYQNGLFYKDKAKEESNFLREVSWRIPMVKDGTSFFLVLDANRNFYKSETGFSFFMNGMYPPYTDLKKQKYWLFSLKEMDDLKGNVPSLSPNVALKIVDRNIIFNGNTSQSIALWYHGSGCLRVIDSTNQDIIPVSTKTKMAAKLTNTSLISNVETPKMPFLDALVGKENKNCWCYYFEKAELARQNKDWNKVIEIIQTAIKKNLMPTDDIEWLDYVEAYLNNSKIDEAEKIIHRYIKSTDGKEYAIILLDKWSKKPLNTQYRAKSQEIINSLIIPEPLDRNIKAE